MARRRLTTTLNSRLATREIAAVVDIQQPSLYNHFPHPRVTRSGESRLGSREFARPSLVADPLIRSYLTQSRPLGPAKNPDSISDGGAYTRLPACTDPRNSIGGRPRAAGAIDGAGADTLQPEGAFEMPSKRT